MGFDEFHGWQISPWLTSASLFLSGSASPHATWSVWSSTCGCRDWARSSWLTWIPDEGATGRIFRYSIPVFRSLGFYHLSSIIEVDSLNITCIPVDSFPSYHNIPWFPCLSAQNARWTSGYIAVYIRALFQWLEVARAREWNSGARLSLDNVDTHVARGCFQIWFTRNTCFVDVNDVDDVSHWNDVDGTMMNQWSLFISLNHGFTCN